MKCYPSGFYLRTTFFLAAISCVVCFAADAMTWHWRNPLPSGNIMFSVAFGNERFVAVGEKGEILTSADGIEWARVNLAANQLEQVIYGNARFVAVGKAGVIMTSTDGISWNAEASPTTNNLNALVFGGGKYVSVGDNGTVLVSSDGLTWSVALSGVANGLSKVTWGGGLFVATYKTSPNIIVSSDGSNWSVRSFVTDASLPSAQQLVFGNGKFLLRGFIPSGFSSGVYDWTSTNGTNWTKSSLKSPGCLGFLNGLFVALDTGFGGPSLVMSQSSDAIIWTNTSGSIALPHANYLFHGVTYGNGKYVMAGSVETNFTPFGPYLWVSINLQEIFPMTRGSMEPVLNLAYGNGLYIATGNPILVSTNGLSFSSINPTNPPGLSNIVHANGVFVSAGGSPNILRSTNGLQWYRRNSGTAAMVNDVTYGSHGWIAVGENGTVTGSTNGQLWTLRTPVTGNDLFGVTYANGLYVAVGGNGTIITSSNGVNWSPQFVETLSLLRDVTYGNGVFIAVGESGTILTSPDGIDWTSQVSGVLGSLCSVTYGDSQFMVVSQDEFLFVQKGPIVLKSLDGIHWEGEEVPCNWKFIGCSFVGDSFWLVGYNGTILQSEGAEVHLEGSMTANNSGFQLAVHGLTAQTFRLQVRTNLTSSWSDLVSLTNDFSPLIWVDTNVSQPERYYRVISP